MVSEQQSAEAVYAIRSALVDLLRRNDYVIENNAEGLSHEDSLKRLGEGGSNLNWLLGHITAGRGVCIKLLGAEPVFTSERARVYKRGSSIPAAADAEPLADLLSAATEAGDRLRQALEKASADQLSRPNPRDAGERVLDAIYFLVWHDTYHAGQTALYRRLAGLSGKF